MSLLTILGGFVLLMVLLTATWAFRIRKHYSVSQIVVWSATAIVVTIAVAFFLFGLALWSACQFGGQCV